MLGARSRRHVGDGLANGCRTRQYSYESPVLTNAAQFTSLSAGLGKTASFCFILCVSYVEKIKIMR